MFTLAGLVGVMARQLPIMAWLLAGGMEDLNKAVDQPTIQVESIATINRVKYEKFLVHSDDTPSGKAIQHAGWHAKLTANNSAERQSLWFDSREVLRNDFDLLA